MYSQLDVDEIKGYVSQIQNRIESIDGELGEQFNSVNGFCYGISQSHRALLEIQDNLAAFGSSAKKTTFQLTFICVLLLIYVIHNW